MTLRGPFVVAIGEMWKLHVEPSGGTTMTPSQPRLHHGNAMLKPVLNATSHELQSDTKQTALKRMIMNYPLINHLLNHSLPFVLVNHHVFIQVSTSAKTSETMSSTEKV